MPEGSPLQVVSAPRQSPAGGTGREVYYLDGDTPLCFVVDRELDHRHFTSSALHSYGIETGLYAKAHDLYQGLSRRTPSMIFLDVPDDTTDAIQSIRVLDERSFRGAVQPMSSAGADALESIRSIGERNGLRMLPPLKKPLDRAAIGKVIRKENLGYSSESSQQISLEEVLHTGWLEFWYQPKIDLRKKQLAGVELFARVRHPDRGVLLPEVFIDSASDESLVEFTRQSLAYAIKSRLSFSAIGINFPIAINVALPALCKISVPGLLLDHRLPRGDWPSLMLDVTEDQLAIDPSMSRALVAQLEACDVRLAIDDFGARYLPLARLKELPFTELKLERSIITDCATDKGRVAVCQSIIEMAHNFGAKATAVGIERSSDAHALFRMACDHGQGHLFAQPMSRDRFLQLLKKRTQTAAAPQPTAETRQN